MNNQIRILGGLVLAGAAAACSDGGGPSANGQRVAFSIATHVATATAPALVGTADTVTDVNNDTLIVTSVQLVLRKITLKRIEDSAPCDTLEDGGDHDGHEDMCEKVQAGPLLLDLPLGAGAATQFTVNVDTGTYSRLRIQLHKPTDDPGDATLLAAHPEMAGASVRVVGTFNGTSFTYTSDLTANQETDLVPPLVVGSLTPTDLTLFVDISHWFLDGGGLVVDPATALNGQTNEHVVRNNIRSSFKSFEDNNHNGEDDHDGHDNGGNDGSGHDNHGSDG